ncbi:peptidyl-prolyl cis-trans isomerase CYP38, chloroplastic isoform X3 [Physcomitrium patens]|uniref:peptidyl-prolyl cis-trans isomerase CYP38, chloroplastic isoform X3 n=1 Tax=Physcomitrium patens TaxID=3218 RepID=UPI000D15F2F1|nr:peptidyl-prolyl cis-trans isomerase CYP38, chloroplastic-like isoform X3 [Physcomitrium patens]|eukprot:XP_024366901.1 peptidyl-prolyl cis-trans isomerase CYP38, chloroplastic-like isoform X3 [Physcomitrella patens]
MAVAAVLQAASLATTTTWLDAGAFRKEGLIGAQCVHKIVSARGPCAIRASLSKDDVAAPNAFAKVLHNCPTCVAVAAALLVPFSSTAADVDVDTERVSAISEPSVLISGPPTKDANALLRDALPLDNKPIKEVQKFLEDITEEMKDVRQATLVLNQSKEEILSYIAESKRQEGDHILTTLNEELEGFQKQLEEKDSSIVLPRQKELLRLIGDLEETMIAKFPYEIPEEYAKRPLLMGRATLEMKVLVKNNPNVKDAVLHIVLDGYNAPVTAGNFVDLVERRFYDGMEIQRSDGFVLQTGDPDGPAEGFVDPATGQVRTVPLEIMVEGQKQPIYGTTLELQELGLPKAKIKLPFNAFGTMAMARQESDNNSGSSQVFWLLKESELTPNGDSIHDGRYAVFGYVTENEGLLANLKAGDVIESIRVLHGLDNLVNPSYVVRLL